MNKIAIHSVPRSGSTWLGCIFDSHPNVLYKYQPLFSYKFKGILTPYSTKDEINDFFNRLLNSEDDFLDQKKDKAAGKIPSFSKSESKHIVYKEVRYHHILNNLLLKDQEVKVIGLIRNPISTIYSWLNAPKEFRPDKGWNEMEEWEFANKKNQGKPEEYNGYQKWKEVAQLFHALEENHPSQFRIITYQKLLDDPVSIIRDTFQFVGMEIHPQTYKFIEDSGSKNNRDAYSVYKNKVHDKKWIGKLDSRIINQITSDLSGTILEQYLIG